MSNFEAFILGLLQGLTEFLPVSSSGHIEIGKALFNLHPRNELLFTVIVHGATVLSTLVVFWKDIMALLGGISQKKSPQNKYVAKILISAIPVTIVGLFFEKQISQYLFGNIVLVSIMLSITGVILLLATYLKSKSKELNYSNAFIIGLAQVIAIMPGISRSGATISSALLLGISREEATRFSFLMVLIPVIGANFLTLFTTEWLDQGIQVMPLLIGFVTAFISGYIACKWMIAIVKKGRLIYFSIYCFAISLIVLASHYLT